MHWLGKGGKCGNKEAKAEMRVRETNVKEKVK